MESAKSGKWLSCQKGDVSRRTNLNIKKEKKKTLRLLPWEAKYQHTLPSFLEANKPNGNKDGKTSNWEIKNLVQGKEFDEGKFFGPLQTQSCHPMGTTSTTTMKSSIISTTTNTSSEIIKNEVPCEKFDLDLKSKICDISSVGTCMELRNHQNAFNVNCRNCKQDDNDKSLACLVPDVIYNIEKECKSLNLSSAIEKACLCYTIAKLDNLFTCSRNDGIPSIQTIVQNV